MKEIGALILINGAIVSGYFLFTSRADVRTTSAFAGVCLIFGLGLIMSERLTAVSVAGLAEITADAESDARAIAEMKRQVEGQRDTMEMIVRDANASREQIEQIGTLATEASMAVETIRDVSEFSMLVLKAQTDHRRAFDDLRAIGEKSGPFQTMAKAAVWDIMSTVILRTQNLRVVPDWTELGIDPAAASLKEFDAILASADAVTRPEILRTVWERSSGKAAFSLGDRLDFLFQEIRDGANLMSVHMACDLANHESKIISEGAHFLQLTDKFSAWWDQHAVDYKSDSICHFHFSSLPDDTLVAHCRIHGKDAVARASFNILNVSDRAKWMADNPISPDQYRSLGESFQSSLILQKHVQDHSFNNVSPGNSVPVEYMFPPDGDANYIIHINQLNENAIQLASMRRSTDGTNTFAYRVFRESERDGSEVLVSEISELRHIDPEFPRNAHGKIEWLDFPEQWKPEICGVELLLK